MKKCTITWEITIEYETKRMPSKKFIKEARLHLHEDIDRAQNIEWLAIDEVPND